MSEPESPTRRALFGAVALPALGGLFALSEPAAAETGLSLCGPNEEVVTPAEAGYPEVDLDEYAVRLGLWHQSRVAAWHRENPELSARMKAEARADRERWEAQTRSLTSAD